MLNPTTLLLALFALTTQTAALALGGGGRGGQVAQNIGTINQGTQNLNQAGNQALGPGPKASSRINVLKPKRTSSLFLPSNRPELFSRHEQ
ncbi:hypothetical protein NX059_006442 [Plenodomus lindquistii]|nr:hypothetical protein NX059_006442 [Plenodomus lindquistii]